MILLSSKTALTATSYIYGFRMLAKSWTKIGSNFFPVKTTYDDSEVNGAYFPEAMNVYFETIFFEHGYKDFSSVASLGNP